MTVHFWGEFIIENDLVMKIQCVTFTAKEFDVCVIRITTSIKILALCSFDSYNIYTRSCHLNTF